jgi:hypothetical protein
MSSIQGFFARAGMKTVEQFEKLKLDAEKSLGIEAELDDPILKEVQNVIVEEEDVLIQIQKMSNDLIDSISLCAKRDAGDMLDCLKLLVKNRGTSEQQYRILAQLNEYRKIADETARGSDSVANWAILEIQSNVLNPIDKQLQRNEEVRSRFWTIKELRRKMVNLSKIANIDKKSRAELATTQKDCEVLENEMKDQLDAMRSTGIVTVDAIWSEYCRIEAEYYARMNEAYLEPSTPSDSCNRSLGEAKIPPHEKIASPVIGGVTDDDEETLAN